MNENQNGYTELAELSIHTRRELVRLAFDNSRPAEERMVEIQEIIQAGVKKKREIESKYASAGADPRQRGAVQCR